jgi:ubiquitin carboxyl-terminal hydrolase 9/13
MSLAQPQLLPGALPNGADKSINAEARPTQSSNESLGSNQQVPQTKTDSNADLKGSDSTADEYSDYAPFLPFGDGSNKIFGFENFGNTCYCNSIVQCLYYTKPFRLEVLKYPIRDASHQREQKLVMKGKKPHPSTVTPTTYTAPPAQPSSSESDTQDKPKVSLVRRTSNFFGVGKRSNSDENASNNNSNNNTGANENSNVTVIVIPNIRNSTSHILIGIPSDPNLNTVDARKKAAILTGPLLNVDHSLNDYGLKESLYTSLKDLFECMVEHESLKGVISPSYLIETLKRENELFRSAQHQDAHEFLNFLLNDVIDTLNAYLDVKQNNIHGLFQGILTNQTKCLTCENVTSRDEPFLDLSIDLNENESLESCLTQFSASEMLSASNKFHCDSCHSLQEAEKKMGVKRFPKVLALHLKRFKYSEEFNRLVKLFNKIKYPLYLHLRSDIKSEYQGENFYQLYGVVVHIGGGPHHGHYVALVKTTQHGWLLFDDETVEKIDETFVLRFVGGDSDLATAYVLFYQQITKEAFDIGESRLSEEKTETSTDDKKEDDIKKSEIEPKMSFDSGLNPKFKFDSDANSHTSKSETKESNISPLEKLTKTNSNEMSIASSLQQSSSSGEKEKERVFKSFKSKFRTKSTPLITTTAESSVSEPSPTSSPSLTTEKAQLRSASNSSFKEPPTDPEPSSQAAPLTPPPPTYSSNSFWRRESAKEASAQHSSSTSGGSSFWRSTSSGKGTDDQVKEREKEKKKNRLSMSFGFKR